MQMLGAKVQDRDTGLWWGVARIHEGGEVYHDAVELMRPEGQERRVSSEFMTGWAILYPPGHPKHDSVAWATPMDPYKRSS